MTHRTDFTTDELYILMEALDFTVEMYLEASKDLDAETPEDRERTFDRIAQMKGIMALINLRLEEVNNDEHSTHGDSGVS